jgi:hypothetical protein
VTTDIGWRSQPYPAEGGTAAEGIRNQLGRPELDLLTVLVREAAQNSWDAGVPGRQIDFHIALDTVGPASMPAWRDLLARGAPNHSRLPLREKLRANTIRLLTVSDRGTTGLGGPTRADQHTAESRDFIAFVRNVGEPRDKELGGGTYGFGKGIFYLVSKPGVVLLHSRCLVENRLETRLIGCALWQSYNEPQDDGTSRPYTGRHWWGDRATDIVEPLTGDDAEAAAHALGLPTFRPDQTGTDVIVIDPDLDERSPEETATFLAETISWQLWPKMLRGSDGSSPMAFSVTCDGVEHTVPNPETFKPLSLFVAAYQKMQGDTGLTLDCYRPLQRLGRLGLARGYVGTLAPTSASTMAGIEENVHHICLMRPAELVVRYYAGPKPLGGGIGYAGVFKADIALDEVYAKAEPPTHDNWVANQIGGRERRFINTTFKRIDEQLDRFVEPGTGEQSSSTATPLGALSSLFSPLVGGAWGDGAATDYAGISKNNTLTPHERSQSPAVGQTDDHEFHTDDLTPSVTTGQGPTGGQGERTPGRHARDGEGTWDARPSEGAARQPRVRYEDDPSLERRNGQIVIVQTFTLPEPGWQRLTARLTVALASSSGLRETDPPIGAPRPVLREWEGPDGEVIAGTELETLGGDGRVWRAIVQPAPDTITEIDLTASPAGRTRP